MTDGYGTWTGWLSLGLLMALLWVVVFAIIWWVFFRNPYDE